MRWFIPSWNGDFRLEADSGAAKLKFVEPTSNERAILGRFLKIARKKKWTDAEDRALDVDGGFIRLSVPVAKAAPVLVKLLKPKKQTLTAVEFKDGKLKVADGTGETLTELAAEPDAKRAVSVARPTPCCPACVDGAVAPASEVLQAFLSPAEHTDWAKRRAIVVTGGLSGHRYMLAHRHSTLARRLHWICYDLEDQEPLHFFDWSVPPEEEILASKLILEHREHWLRNEATAFAHSPVYKNPFGDLSDGRPDAHFLESVGRILSAVSDGPS